MTTYERLEHAIRFAPTARIDLDRALGQVNAAALAGDITAAETEELVGLSTQIARQLQAGYVNMDWGQDVVDPKTGEILADGIPGLVACVPRAVNPPGPMPMIPRPRTYFEPKAAA